MLLAGIPLYICASASTPVAAALVLKGLSPGAALVFLLAGPATNAATLSLAAQALGKRAALVYLGAIALCSLLLGRLTDQLYRSLDLDTSGWIGRGPETSEPLIAQAAAALLLLLILRSRFATWRRHRK